MIKKTFVLAMMLAMAISVAIPTTSHAQKETIGDAVMSYLITTAEGGNRDAMAAVFLAAVAGNEKAVNMVASWVIQSVMAGDVDKIPGEVMGLLSVQALLGNEEARKAVTLSLIGVAIR